MGGAAPIVPPFFRLTLALAVSVGVAVEPRPAQFASGINLVEVYATVTDSNGQVVTRLGAGDFQVSEDGQPQTMATFAAGEFPLAVAVGLDRSFSMTAERLAMAKSAARAFIRELRPADQVMVLAIGSETETVAPISTDHVRAEKTCSCTRS